MVNPPKVEEITTPTIGAVSKEKLQKLLRQDGCKKKKGKKMSRLKPGEHLNPEKLK